MKNKEGRILVILLFLFLVYSSTSLAQDRMNQIQNKLDVLRGETTQLDQEIDISVSDLSIHEFLRGVAQSTGLNISVDNSLNFKVANSFKGVIVYDLLLFLCRQYNLDVKNQGSIIHIYPYDEPKKKKEETKEKEISITYHKGENSITIDANEVLLWKLTKSITQKTGVNILPDKTVRNEKVSVYISKLKIEDAILSLCKSNDLEASKEKAKSWIIYKKDLQNKRTIKTISKSTANSVDFSKLNADLGQYVKIDIKDNVPLISVSAYNAPIAELIKYISDSLKVDYAFVGQIDAKVTVNMFSQTYDEFIGKMLKSSEYSCKKDDNVYYFTSESDKTFSVDKRIQLLNRTIENIIDNIPDALKEGVEISELPELNSLFLSGESNCVTRLEDFIKDIDQVIPVILIEVLIVDVSKTNNVSTGINAGFGDNPQPASQSVMPGIDYQFSTKQLNNIFQKFESFGGINLGKVNPDFYFAIKALEENGLVNVRSSPKLSTLNGCKANLTSGETKYYKEEQSNFYGSQNPALTNSFTWKPINADVSISILPVVSGDDQVTLDIEVQQSEFTAREFEDSPPGSATRTFKSIMRVRNQDMVLLGGLDKISTSTTGKGIPLLSRIPIIKWLFSSKTNSKSNSKLNVFIKPTIIS